MDIPALQTRLFEKYGVRVPGEDPVWIVVAAVEEYLDQREVVAKTPLTDADLTRISKRLDARMLSRAAQLNRALVVGVVLALVMAVGLGVGAGWLAFAPALCADQADGSRACWVRLPRQ